MNDVPRTPLRAVMTVRTEAGTKYKTNISQKTGLAQYEHLLPGTQQQKRAGRSKGLNASLLRLYTEYSHSADVIESVASVCSNKLPTRKSRCIGSKKRRKEEAHLQLVVQWAPSMQPRWIANVAVLLGYKIDEMQPVQPQPTPHCLESGYNFRRPCEFCKQTDTADAVNCSVCQRMYHRGCLEHNKMPTPPPADSQQPAHAYTCSECTHQAHESEEQRRHHQDMLQIVHVRWKHKEEQQQTVLSEGTERAKQEMAEKLRAHAQRLQEATQPPKRRQSADTTLDPPPPPQGKEYDITIGETIRTRLIIHAHAIDPHTDVHPREEQAVVVREVLTVTRHDAQSRLPVVDARQLACLTETDGRCSHTLPTEVVASLHARYRQMRQLHPEKMEELKAGTFVEELHKLVARYTEGTTIPGKQDTSIQYKHERALPAAARRVIMQAASANKERLASPLNVHPLAGEYWTPHQRDQVFGAGWDAYTVRWTGASVATPEADSAATTKAKVWALSAAQDPSAPPTLTLLVLPSYAGRGVDESHANWARRQPQHCRHLLTVPASCVRLLPAANAPGGQPTRSQWNVHIIAVGNAAGYRQFLPAAAGDWLQRLAEDLTAALATEFDGQALPKPLQLTDEEGLSWPDGAGEAQAANGAAAQHSNQHAQLSCRYRKLPMDNAQSRRTSQIGTTTGPPAARPAAELLAEAMSEKGMLDARQAPLRYNWEHFMYTDGSLQTQDATTTRQSAPPPPSATDAAASSSQEDGAPPLTPPAPGIGAAVYDPATKTAYAVACADASAAASAGASADASTSQQQQHTVPAPTPAEQADDCMAAEGINTINRAELAGIHTAIRVAKQQAASLTSAEARIARTINIATDSLTSLYQIDRYLQRPQDMREHRHANLLSAIITDVNNAPVTMPVIHLWKVKSHIGIVGNEFADRVAVAVAAGRTQTLGRDVHLQTVETVNYDTPSNNRALMYWPHVERRLSNTATADTAAMLTPLPNLAESLKKHMHAQHKLGSANKESIYVKAWQGISARLDVKFSHLFTTSTKVKEPERKRATQCRWGQLPTNKNLHRWKKRPDSNCPLCMQPDGGHHAISACPAVSNAVTLRHNKAGTAIVQAILKGSRGEELRAADVGYNRHVQQAATAAEWDSDDEGSEGPSDNTAGTTGTDGAASSPAPPGNQRRWDQSSIPDATLQHTDPATGREKYTLVEIKYCEDTRPEGQETRAREQHQALKHRLESGGADVSVVTIMLGVTGAIYKDTTESLQQLGVTGAALPRLLKHLHFHAVTSLNTIWKHRCTLIREKLGGRVDRTGGGSRMEKEEQQPPEPDALPTTWDAAAAAAGGARRNISRSGSSSSNYRDSTASPSGAGRMVDLIADASHLLGERQEGVSTLVSYAP